MIAPECPQEHLPDLRKFVSSTSTIYGPQPSPTFLFPCPNMAYDVHRIVQEPEDVNHRRLLWSADPIQHDVPAFPPFARHVQCHQPCSNFIASPPSGNLRPRRQRFDCPGQGLGIDTRLRLSKPFGCPAENVPEIVFCRRCQTDSPTAAAAHYVLSSLDELPPSVSAVRADRLSRSASAASNDR